MRILIQRVTEAKLQEENLICFSIQKGLVLLVGVEDADTPEDAKWASAKISKMRIFQDEEGKTNLSIIDIQGEILTMSQFTLFASTAKGNRPSFIRAGNPEHAKKLYDFFCQCLRKDIEGLNLFQGTFASYCTIHIANDGPTTIWIDTKNKE